MTSGWAMYSVWVPGTNGSLFGRDGMKNESMTLLKVAHALNMRNCQFLEWFRMGIDCKSPKPQNMKLGKRETYCGVSYC